MNSHLKNKVITITGGTGSFGNALIRRLLGTDVAEIRVFSRDEKKQDDMRHMYKTKKVKYYLGDVRNRRSLSEVLTGTDFVFHAAALKQVPSCEFYPMEAVETNTVGADNVLLEATDQRVKKVVVLSTDKAAYPINAMGMSKALMEKVMVARSRVASARGVVLCGTRYGNVIASRGSVIPLFIQQLRSGAPLTLTDPEMTRFMMSLDDAIDLVLHAFENAKPGDLFVQKAFSSTLKTVAEAVQELVGVHTEIKVIGTRHGEKLYETLLTREEMARAEESERYFRVPADGRDINYNIYFSEGKPTVSAVQDFHSHNATRLGRDALVGLLSKVPEVQAELIGGIRKI